MKLISSMYQPLFLLFSILLISQYLKDKELVNPLLSKIYSKLSNKKLLLFVFVNILGFLPVPGRITLACGVLDTIQDKTKDNKKMGILAYLSTHHYYLWSPIEKSVIIAMTAAGIGYLTFIKMMLPAIIVYAILLLLIYFVYVKDHDINFTFEKFSRNEFSKTTILLHISNLIISLIVSIVFKSYYLFFGIYMFGLLVIDYKQWYYSLKKIDYMILLYLSMILVGAYYIQVYSTPYFKNIVSISAYIYTFLILSFIGSLLLGSSSRYAALTAIGVTLFGVKYLPLFYIIDYAGYFLSPTHKCTMISKMYFNVPLKYYYGVLLGFIIAIITSVILINTILTN
jgi:hypothetical protein